MSLLSDLIEAGQRVEAHNPWPRVIVSADQWRGIARALAAGDLTLLSLWAEPGAVHLAVHHADPHTAKLGRARPNTVSPNTAKPGNSNTTSPAIASPDTASPDTASPAIAAAGNVSPAAAGPGAAADTATSNSTSPNDASPGYPGPEAADVDSTSPDIAVFTIACPGATYPAISAHHPPAIRLERTIRDLFEIQPEGLPDTRPWLDHGAWSDTPPEPYRFLPAEGDALHQIPVGPVHAGIIEPGHFRFTCHGETVVRLEQRLGYVHKGIDLLMARAPIPRAARLASRVSGDSTVAYALAFARAVESATGTEPPPRAIWLRAVMAELERIANHIGDVGAICNDASFSLMLTHAAVLREQTLRTAADCFGHRLMMDRIVPGGVTHDLDAPGLNRLRALIDVFRARMPRLNRLYDETPSLLDRTVTTGIVRPGLARQFGAGGFVGRASGRDFDTRRDIPYAPYDRLAFKIPVRTDGDVNARIWIRLREIEASIALLDQLLTDLPEGAIGEPITEPPPDIMEGMALAEAFRGDVLVWLRLSGGTVERCHLRDASWFQWPLLEAAIEGNIVADFPLCNKSFNCSYSGHDL